jgi:ABC-2 type transport system permease protein
LLEVQSVENDKLEVLPAYMGLVIAYEDRKERIPIIESTDKLEYELAAAFKRVMRSEKIKVCYSLGQGETDLEEYKTLFQILKTNYNMISIDLTEEVRIPERYEALLIVDPKEQFADQAKYAIDQYIMKGGKVAFLTGKAKYDPTFKNKYAEILDLGLDEMLAHYGIVINNDVVRDKQCGPITVVKEQEGHSIKNRVSYPFIPSVYDISRVNPIVKQLWTLIFIFLITQKTVFP